MSVKADTHAVRKAARLRSLPPATPSALVKLQERMRGFISVPGMDDYGAASAGNALYPSQPLAIAFCATETDDLPLNLDQNKHNAFAALGALARRRLVQADGSSDEGRESILIDLIVLVEVDCAPGVASEA